MRRRLFPLISVLLLAMGSTSLDAGEASAALAAAADEGTVEGMVQTPDGKRLENALVVLQCSCLPKARETTTNDAGLYLFRGLPPGSYTVQVFAGKASVSKIIQLTVAGRFRANFRIGPQNELKRTIRVKPQLRKETAVGQSISMEEFRNIPVGGQAARDFTQVVESSASAFTGGGGPSHGGIREPTEPYNREGYAHVPINEFLSSVETPLSTFSVDVDTASYANVRRFIEHGQRPPAGAVRIEELVNYFDYGYVEPKGKKPVSVNWEVSECPWNADHLLARIGLQTARIAEADVPPRNLVFLLDVSGSMSSPTKLPLLKRALQLLVDNLRPQDTVSIVVYAGEAGVVLKPTSGRNLPEIRDAIADLEPGGSTNGAGGIRTAYRLAKRAFIHDGINRVILATDGDFNVGTTSHSALVKLIETKRKSGVFLSVLGFGSGNLQDETMELLADKGNGNYAYIDSLQEARKVLVEEAGATLVTVAKDVKLQVEFNPNKVADYRLIGYENRLLADKDFEDDTKDAGEMGAGHSVTAIYELVPASGQSQPRKTRKLRYQGDRTTLGAASSEEWMTVAVRYKPPTSDRSHLLEVPMAGVPKPLGRASDDLRFAAAVAAYGMLLRDSPHKGKTSLKRVEKLAKGALGQDSKGYRAQFLELVDATRRIKPTAESER